MCVCVCVCVCVFLCVSVHLVMSVCEVEIYVLKTTKKNDELYSLK